MILIRDVLAGLLAAVLLASAAKLAGALRHYRRQRERTRNSERALGRTIVAEIPAAQGDLLLFSEDDVRFYYGDHPIDKDLIAAVRLLVNGEPVTVRISNRSDRRAAAGGGDEASARNPASTGADGFARERWDVAIDTLADPTIVACGSIREGVSQELARAVFAAVAREIDRRDIDRRENDRRDDDPRRPRSAVTGR
jgi:hypothetical protein